ncbi:MAG: YeeE/YedE family protein [Kiritimatiellae bacterium]|nr:YeeE/YedE family protein [Kiritimatiellia bacterium]
MAPLNILEALPKLAAYGIYFLLGISFGSVLELSGFGDSRKLSGQFYLRDMTVLKVMFTAIITACVMLYLGNSLGLIAFERVFVNHTYLWPGIIGGLIMGVGFIIGGFCPGTSIVALATLKIDGVFFATGVSLGTLLFSVTVQRFSGLWNASYMGRLTIPEVFEISNGWVVFGVVVMAMAMFYAAELSEQFFGEKRKRLDLVPISRLRLVGMAALLGGGLLTLIVGDPSSEDKWARIPKEEKAKLADREVYVSAGEFIEAASDDALYLNIIDVRDQSSFNLFHFRTAERYTLDQLHTINTIKALRRLPDNTVNVVVSNGEVASTEAYKLLRGEGIINLYILEGGINQWLTDFAGPNVGIEKVVAAQSDTTRDRLRFRFSYAVGDNYPFARLLNMKSLADDLTFERKIKIEKKAGLKGGCS